MGKEWNKWKEGRKEPHTFAVLGWYLGVVLGLFVGFAVTESTGLSLVWMIIGSALVALIGALFDYMLSLFAYMLRKK